MTLEEEKNLNTFQSYDHHNGMFSPVQGIQSVTLDAVGQNLQFACISAQAN